MARRKNRTFATLLALVLAASTSAVWADDHEEVIRKVDIVEVGKSGEIDASIDVVSAGQPTVAAIQVLHRL